jgi:hypothetical protein
MRLSLPGFLYSGTYDLGTFRYCRGLHLFRFYGQDLDLKIDAIK